MLVISKKRLRIILGGILLGLFAFSFQIANKETKEINNTIQVTATPVSGKTVVLDAGHRKTR